MATRWMRGLVPRAAREVIFGIGLNQLSDYCEERVPDFVGKFFPPKPISSILFIFSITILYFLFSPSHITVPMLSQEPSEYLISFHY